MPIPPSILLVLAAFALLARIAVAADPPSPLATTTPATAPLDLGLAWSGHPVGFALLTHSPHQFVAYYDDQRRLTVASRQLDQSQGKSFHMIHLPTSVAWDSHNYIAMTIDDEGLLHLSGNMHCVPLIYFRTEKPFDIDSFQKIPNMVGTNENSCTYPKFLRGPNRELIFTYRDGRSGNGQQIWNVYAPATRSWRRLLDQPLFSGGGKMNAYFNGPQLGPDGLYHVVWVWRNTPDCASNHDLSYARSRDLVHWETSAGQPLALPITVATGEVVDPVPPGGGIINGNTHIGFDSQKRLILSYHKFDADGNTQLYNARLEDGHWKIYQTSDWAYRWNFSGGGTIIGEIGFSPVTVGEKGRLTQSYHHIKEGSGTWLLDESTLKPTGKAPPKPSPYPAAARRVTSSTPGMQVRWLFDTSTSEAAPGTPRPRYALRWETLGANRDQPRPEIPPPTKLELYEFPAD